MRYLIIILVSMQLGYSAELQLNNDKPHQEKLDLILGKKPDGKDPNALHQWLWEYGSACFKMRDYPKAEIASRAACAIYPQYFANHSQLSVFLGKQGKYEEALREAEIALLLCDSETMHAEAIACSWQLMLGQKNKAIERFNKILIPLDDKKKAFYYSCKSCFFADLGDVTVLQDSIKKSIVDPANKSFYERDVVFDKFRNEQWFIDLIGPTIQKPQ